MTALSLFAQKLFKRATSRFIIYVVILGMLILTTNVACGKRAYHTAAPLEETPISKGCRVIQHSLGETCIPTEPKRIVTLDIYSLGNSIALGIEPVGSGHYSQTGELPKYLKSRESSIKHIGTDCQPNIERILLLKPDFILGSQACPQNYPLLSKIAPTVFNGIYVNTDWQENFNFTSYILGRKSSAQIVWDHYYERIKKMRSVLDAKQQDIEVSVVDIFGSQLYPYTKNSFVGSILDDIGLKIPESQNIVSEFGFVPISEEELQKLDCDILFVVVRNSNDEKFLETLKQKPLWKKLRVAQTNQIHAVEDHVWLGGNPLAANLVLDDLYKYLVNTP